MAKEEANAKQELEDKLVEIKDAKDAQFAELKYVKYPTMANYSMGVKTDSAALKAEVEEIVNQENTGSGTEGEGSKAGDGEGVADSEDGQVN